MKHYSGDTLARAASLAGTSPLLTEEDLVIELAGRLDGRRGEQGRAADQLGIAQCTLSNILTKGRGIGPDLAETLGYRRVVRFEPIDT